MAFAHSGGHFRLPDTNTLWVFNETDAIFITASFAAIIAFWGVFSQRSITARQSTIQYLRDAEQDIELGAARSVFSDLTKDPAQMATWADAAKTTSPQAKAIKTILNDYELIAIGIERGTLDDTTFRRWLRSQAVRDWERAAPYVMATRARTGNGALYHEFEEMARRYRDGKGMPHRRIFWAKFF